MDFELLAHVVGKPILLGIMGGLIAFVIIKLLEKTKCF